MPEPAPTPNEATEAAVKAADILISDIFQTRQEAERVLTAQAAVVRGNGARAIFVPGNHDWDQSNIGGWKRILAQETFLNQLRTNDGLDVSLQPPGGCPGPVRIPLQAAADLIVLDTEWWLNPTDQEKPTPANNPTDCPVPHRAGDPAGAARPARGIVQGEPAEHRRRAPSDDVEGRAQRLRRRVDAHLPAARGPLLRPVLRRMAAAAGARLGDGRDPRLLLAEPAGHAQRYEPCTCARRSWRRCAKRAISGAAPLAYVAGHDHGLQVFSSPAGPAFTLVSGLGSKGRASEVGHNSRTLFAHSNGAHPGFMQLDFLRDGHVRFAVIEYAGEKLPPAEVYSFVYPRGNAVVQR